MKFSTDSENLMDNFMQYFKKYLKKRMLINKEDLIRL